MTEETKYPGVVDRLASAFATLRGEDDLSRYNLLQLEAPQREVKLDAMRHPSYGGNGWSTGTNLINWTGSFSGSQVNYADSVGDLMQSSLVMAVVNWVGTNLPEAWLQVVLEGDDGKATVQPSHPLTQRMRRPNDYTTLAQMWFAFSISWWIDGNVYWHKIRSDRGEVVELWYIPHYMISPAWSSGDPTKFITEYVYTVDGRRYAIPASDIVHFKRGISLANPRKGVGAFESVLRELYGDHAAATFSAALLRNTGVVSHVISPKTDSGFEETQARAVKAQFVQQTTGDNAGSPVVQTIPVDVTRLGFSPQELDLNRLRYMPEARIAAVTGIPAAVLQFMIGQENGTSYASYEQARKQAYESVIIPIQSAMLEVLDAFLLPEFSDKQNEYCEFDLSRVRVLQEGQDSLVTRTARLFTSDIIKRGEARTTTGFALAKDGTDDLYYSQLRNQPKPATDESPTPPKQLQSKSLKSVEWDGLTLSREPNDLEKIAVKAISEAQESGKEKIAKILLKLRESLFTEAVDGLLKLDAASYHTLTIDPPAAERKTLRVQLASVYLSGREQVIYELGEQGSNKSFLSVGRKAVEEADDVDELDSLSNTILSSVINDAQASASSLASRLAVLGIVGDALRKRLASELPELSTASLDRASSGAAHVALGMGRADEAEARSDEWKSIQYSALLDRNTCSSCEESDGQEAESEDDLPPAPNPDCDGGWLCRCFLIYVAV